MFIYPDMFWRACERRSPTGNAISSPSDKLNFLNVGFRQGRYFELYEKCQYYYKKQSTNIYRFLAHLIRKPIVLNLLSTTGLIWKLENKWFWIREALIEFGLMHLF